MEPHRTESFPDGSFLDLDDSLRLKLWITFEMNGFADDLYI